MNRILQPRLARYLITDGRAASAARMAEISEQALRGGMTALQLRASGWTDRARLDAALRLREIANRYDALFIVNDRVDLALASDADGVHLGVDDLPVSYARRLMGERAVIGYSPEHVDDAKRAIADGASYLGVGPVYRTSTKNDAGEPIGVEGIRSIARAVRVPVIGVGGISLHNACAVVEAGAAGVAVVSAVFRADDPECAARLLAEALS